MSREKSETLASALTVGIPDRNKYVLGWLKTSFGFSFFFFSFGFSVSC